MSPVRLVPGSTQAYPLPQQQSAGWPGCDGPESSSLDIHAQTPKPRERAVSAREVSALLQQMKEELSADLRTQLRSELRAELGTLTNTIQEANRQLASNLAKVAMDVQALHHESIALPVARSPGPSATQALASAVTRICGGDAGAKVERWSFRTPTVMTIAEEPRPSQVPRSEVMSPRYQEKNGVGMPMSVPRAVAGTTPARSPSPPVVGKAAAASSTSAKSTSLQIKGLPSSRAEATSEAPPQTIDHAPQKELGPSTMLSAVVTKFQLATNPPGGMTASEVTELAKEPFVAGLEALAGTLSALGGGDLGSHLLKNIVKLRQSKADSSKSAYSDWLLSELPVHAETGYSGYVDASAWMGNLWIGWTMEFFVEFFACLSQGMDSKSSWDAAYQKSLYNHHNFFQRGSFTAAKMQLPDRETIMKKLQGNAGEAEALRDTGKFVDVCRPIVRFVLKTNDMLEKRMIAKRKGQK